MVSLLKKVRDACLGQGLNRVYWVGYSGGLDSHVLLTLCDQLRAEIGLNCRAIHVHHGLHQDASSWAAHCARVCAEKKIPYEQKNLVLSLDAGQSVEAIAREGRYAAFASVMQPGDVLLTAHHQDDQAETVLLQLSRGAGLKGLSAMPAVKSFAQGLHMRPLLSFSRNDLASYAEAQRLVVIEDPANHHLRFSRNVIRHNVLPHLTSLSPGVASAIVRSAAHCAEAQALLASYVTEDIKACRTQRDDVLSVSRLLMLSPERQRLVLRAWIQQLGFLLPSTKRLATIMQTVLHARSDAMPVVRWGTAIVRRYRDGLYLMADQPKPSVHRLRLKGDLAGLSVRFRQAGESVALAGRRKQNLKNLFQRWGVPPWERAHVPLLFIENRLIAAAGYFISPAYAAGEDEVAVEFTT
ncbi:MAG TPA: tRNA lysidine(34) synthetase TilS [Gammaproteobacteria bacterium]|jgi:tRNA(Ile)-lysidine synthase|nr:tRNA lysidine(34) synthetase TilS [Gammaproteobacteria bacterium]